MFEYFFVQMKVYCDWSEALRSYNMMDDFNNVKAKMTHLKTEYNISETFDSEESQEQETTSQLSTDDLLMLESGNCLFLLVSAYDCVWIFHIYIT